MQQVRHLSLFALCLALWLHPSVDPDLLQLPLKVPPSVCSPPRPAWPRPLPTEHGTEIHSLAQYLVYVIATYGTKLRMTIPINFTISV